MTPSSTHQDSTHQKPQLSFWQIWNMCFGFLGIQFGFALQNANVSRIFQTLGASMDDIPMLWIAAPLTGLVVQPIVGYLSDRTWTGLGRRRPYFLAGAVLTSLALFFMPNSPTLWIAAGLLWILDASINISMEPFRAFVGDQLPVKQRASGYAMQSFFIGIGAVVASLLPWLLAKFGVSNIAAAGEVPDTVRYAFYAGGAVLLGAIGWTVLRTREYPPETLKAWDEAPPLERRPRASAHIRRNALAWLLVGAGGLAAVAGFGWDRQLYIFAGLVAAYGVALAAALRRAWRQRVHPHHGRPLRHAADDAAAGGGAVLLVVRAVRDVDLHHRRGDQRALRQRGHHLGRVQRRRQLGRRAVCRLQRFRRAGRGRDPVDGEALGPAHQSSDQRHPRWAGPAVVRA